VKVQELLSSEDRWCRVHLAMNKDGKATAPNDPDACRWCLLGALLRCGATPYWEQIAAVIKKRTGGKDMSLSIYNDAPDRTFEDIKSLLQEADV
jgi:hypothetical protein